MNLISSYQQSKANRNYLVELFAFLPFLTMIFSGVIMLKFHTSGNEKLLVFGIEKINWLLFHKISACVALSMVFWHLAQHSDWIKKLFSLKLKNKFKRLNTALFFVFALTVLTATFSWLIFPEIFIGEGLTGIHSKLGFTTIILFFFHIKNYFPWLKKMTIKIFSTPQ